MFNNRNRYFLSDCCCSVTDGSATDSVTGGSVIDSATDDSVTGSADCCCSADCYSDCS